MMIVLALHPCPIRSSRNCSNESHLTFSLCRWRSDPRHPICATELNQRQNHTNRQRDREKMKQLLKTTVASAAAVFALGFVAMSTPAAAASNIDYCRTDITSGM